MIASNIAGVDTTPVIPLNQNKDSISQVNIQKKSEMEKVEKVLTVEEYVRKYFSDIPILVEVARCESQFRQHDKEGGILRGEQNSLDRGVMQINEYYHGEDSKKLGYDILTLEGNTAYARYIYEKYGVQPWQSSSPCWKKTEIFLEYQELAKK